MAGDRSPPLGNAVLPLQKCALMEQVAHQTIVMQFILELAKSLKVDPRACFRQFFTKIKVGRWSSSGIQPAVHWGRQMRIHSDSSPCDQNLIHQQRISP